MEKSTSPRNRIAFLVTAAAFLAAPGVHAAALARYEFTDSTLVSTDDDPTNTTSTASDFALGPGFAGGGDYLVVAGSNTRIISVALVNSNTEGAAYTGQDYFEFSITPAAGYQLNLSSISLDFDASYTTQPRGYGIRTSIDNYANSVFTNTEATGTGTTGTMVNTSTDLSAAGFQNLTSGITFRITVFDNATTTTNNERFDNIIVNGTVTAIPEPSAAGLAGVAGLVLLLTRRRA